MEEDLPHMEAWLAKTVEMVAADCRCFDLTTQLKELADLADLPTIAKVADQRNLAIR